MGRCSIILLLFVYRMNLQAADENRHGFQYVSPVPGSAFVSQEINIIIRPGNLIERNSTTDGHLVSVAGTQSGLHPGKLILSGDSRTLIFVPSAGFAEGETVTVSVRSGIRTPMGSAIAPTSFFFTITSTPKELQRPRPPLALEDIAGQSVNQHSHNVVQESTLLDSLPQDFPRINVSALDNPFPGYIFPSNFTPDTTLHNTSYLMILNNIARPIIDRWLHWISNCSPMDS